MPDSTPPEDALAQLVNAGEPVDPVQLVAAAEKSLGALNVRIVDVDVGEDDEPRILVSKYSEGIEAYLTGGRIGDLPGGALEPAHNPERQYELFEDSAHLRPCVDAYVTNIDSFGHAFLPVIDLGKDAEARKTVADALLYARVQEAEEAGAPRVSVLDEVAEPTDEEIDAEIAKMRRHARVEYLRLKWFFSTVSADMPFIELRKRTRQDLEVTGNAYWEVTRNGLGELAKVHYLSPITTRLTKQDTTLVDVEEPEWQPLGWRFVPTKRKFRRFVRLDGAKVGAYFKEFGDPRVLSRKSGEFYASEADMRTEEGADTQSATEVIHFSIFTPASEYGGARWTPAAHACAGTVELDSVNLNFFHNNVVPPLALLCSGGRLGDSVAARIEGFINEHLKGKKGLHRILVLEAEGQRAEGASGPTAAPKLQFVPLRDAQQQDALFQDYDKRNEEKVAKTFRLPRILRGDDVQINRSVAFASLRFAEDQVFEPIRQDFDGLINYKFLPLLGVRLWTFRSNAPITRDPERVAELVIGAVKVGVLLPAEGSALFADIFNRPFTRSEKGWSQMPLPLLLMQAQQQGFTWVDDEPVFSPEEPDARPVAAPSGVKGPGAAAPRAPGAPLGEPGEPGA